MDHLLALYAGFKRSLPDYGIAEDLAHVHAGLLIFFFVALLSRRRMRSMLPIGVVYGLAIANELIDLRTPGASANPWEPVIDILNTVVWPTLLFLLARRRSAS